MRPDAMTLPGTRWAKSRGCTCPEPVKGARSPEYGMWPVMDVAWNCKLHGLQALLEVESIDG
jgi:hypothetical protein